MSILKNKKGLFDDAIDVLLAILILFIFILILFSYVSIKEKQVKSETSNNINTFRLHFLINQFLKEKITFENNEITNSDLLSIYFTKTRSTCTKTLINLGGDKNAQTLLLNQFIINSLESFLEENKLDIKSVYLQLFILRCREKNVCSRSCELPTIVIKIRNFDFSRFYIYSFIEEERLKILVR